MLIRYSPGEYDDKIPFPVQKKVITCERKGDSHELIALEVAGGRAHELKIHECAPLMSRQNRVRSWLKLIGLFLLFIAFCAGTNNILSRLWTGGCSPGVLDIVQIVMGLALLSYLTWVLKTNVERHIYGGLKISSGEIYFQSEKEKSLFGDVSENERRTKDDSKV